MNNNAGGVALVLELARIFKKDKVKRNIRFILFSEEELGLRGSYAYVKS
ncbi:MAG: hypothetical protein DRJ45_02890 [Thermoprotei archaeon]|nr:MAG: hypothetical protein DRJ45_02890 [Thermoprotei archaeon]